MHENQTCPPSLSQSGIIRYGTKSHLVECLENAVNQSDAGVHPSPEVVILDGAVIVNMLKLCKKKQRERFS